MSIEQHISVAEARRRFGEIEDRTGTRVKWVEVKADGGVWRPHISFPFILGYRFEPERASA